MAHDEQNPTPGSSEADQATQRIPRVIPGTAPHTPPPGYQYQQPQHAPVAPPPPQAHMPVASQPGYAPVAPSGAAPPPPPATSPPPPQGQGGRGAGFWVAVSAGGAALAMLLLVGGLLFGRSTRDSSQQVQAKIEAQKQADQISQTKQLQDLADKLRNQRANAVRTAADRARARGIREGRTEGRQTGYQEGRTEGRAEGESSGYAQGTTSGYSSGFDDALCLADSSLC